MNQKTGQEKYNQVVDGNQLEARSCCWGLKSGKTDRDQTAEPGEGPHVG
jgi:hypothetical protein